VHGFVVGLIFGPVANFGVVVAVAVGFGSGTIFGCWKRIVSGFRTISGFGFGEGPNAASAVQFEKKGGEQRGGRRGDWGRRCEGR
jgi:hypothetical protein